MRKLILLLAAQIAKFGIVGVICFVIDYAILYLCTGILTIPYLISAAIAYIISTIINYFLSMRYVFHGGDRNKIQEFLIFFILSTVGLALTEIIMYVCTSKIGMHYMMSKIISTAIVMIFNFVTRKTLLEKKE